MRKKLLSLLLAAVGLSFASFAGAKEITKYTIDETKEVSLAPAELDGKTLLITDETKAYTFGLFGGSDWDMKPVAIDDYKTSVYAFVKFELVKDADTEVEGPIYRLSMINKNGEEYHYWAGVGYLNFQPGTNKVIFALGSSNPNYGQDAKNHGLFTVTYEAGKGYVLENVGRRNEYLSPASANPIAVKTYVKMYSDFGEETEIVPDYSFDATSAKILDMATATNYDKEVGKFTADGGFEFAEPQDFSSYKWLVVTTTYNASQSGGEFRIKDANGKSVGGAQYHKGNGASRGDMWIDRWNNQICATVDMEHIAYDNDIDITKITGISFKEKQPIGAVYLTNYEAGKAVADKSGWGNCPGDYIREYAELPNGKYGTIALPYTAAVSGAYLYTVESFDVNAGLVLSRHYGVAKAGVPYFYSAIDEVGLDGDAGAGKNYNVNFFRVDANEVNDDVMFADNANGLVGCLKFGLNGKDHIGNLTGSYVLSNGELRLITENSTGVTIGLNHCIFDPTKYIGAMGGEASVRIPMANDATAIQSIANAAKSGKIYDMNGREVKAMQKGGMYIMDGIKVYVK